jgi:hypothetical protein
MTASTYRTSFAIWIVLTQSSTVIMPRRPMIIFDETVVSGTVLFLTPPLKSTTLSPSLRTIANQVERSSGKDSCNRWRNSSASV